MADKLARFRMIWRLAVCVFALFIATWFVARSQPVQQEKGTRDITKDFKEGRPKARKAKPSQPHKTTPVYDIQTEPLVALNHPKVDGDAKIGVTIWRLRPSVEADKKKTRDLIQEGDEATEWTAERVKADTPIAEGQRLRVSIETSREGFLYVINRIKYADGKPNDYLIFPKLSNGTVENTVKPGRVIRVPSPNDKQPYFKMKYSKSAEEVDQIAEELVILVVPRPLEDISIEDKRLKLLEGQLDQWKKRWEAPVERAEQRSGVGLAITPEEKQAAENPALLLTQIDPYPQTIYRVATKLGAPLMVTVPLRIAR